MDVLVAREAAEDAASAEEIKLLLAENNLRIAQTEQDLDVAFKMMISLMQLTLQGSSATGLESIGSCSKQVRSLIRYYVS